MSFSRWPDLPPPRLPGRARSWIVLAVAALGIALTLWFLNRAQPLEDWLFWRFAGIYGLVLFFGLACLCSGHALLAWPCSKDPMVIGERLLLDMAAGVLLFATGTFLVGIVHGLGSFYFWLLPSALLVAGAPLLVRDGVGMLSELRRARSRIRHPPSLATNLAIGFGAIGLLLVYLPLLTPDNVAFDASWYHLAIAEHYVAAGRIAPFAEGWHLGALPHLASWLYTWALASPVFDLWGRLELAAHLEFFLFLWTLAAVPILVVRLTGAGHGRGTWAVFFLFPGIFLYDSSLATAADHILAFWAAPLALSALWFVNAYTPKRAFLLAVVCAGAALTKMQSLYLLVPTALFVLGCTAFRALARKERVARLCYVLALPLFGSFLLLSASHWLANAIWYHNPVYPMLGGLFPSHPWRTELVGSLFDQGWTPDGTFWMRIGKTLLAPFTFAYVPHDWFMFHRDLPVFGFLFTLAMALLPVLRRTRRIWVLGLGTVLGLLIWFATYHQDRYLQALLPWMVVVTSATFLTAWNTGFAARIAIVALVALQLVWGGDIPFIPARLGDRTTMIEKAIHMLSATYRKDQTGPFETHTGFEKVAPALPPESVVLYHLGQLRLGIGHPAVTDNPRWTSAPLLGSVKGPAAAWRQLHDWGVTHLLFQGERCDPGDLNLQSELATHYLAQYASDGTQYVDGKTLVTLSKVEPTQTNFPDVLYVGCSKRGRVAWHDLDETYGTDRLAPSEPAHDLPAIDERLFAGLQCAVVEERCPIQLPSVAGTEWKRVTRWKQAQLWMRGF
ncbi:MAG TPA: hypothetical protein VIM14_10380 [Polyangia bacterium]